MIGKCSLISQEILGKKSWTRNNTRRHHLANQVACRGFQTKYAFLLIVYAVVEYGTPYKLENVPIGIAVFSMSSCDLPLAGQ